MLNGRPVLIVEQEFLIALDIQRMLEAMGVGQTLFANNAHEARQLASHWPDLALAIVEMRMDDMGARQLTDELSAASIPVVVTSGNINLAGTLGHARYQMVRKPIPEEDMASAVALAIQS